MNALFEIQPVRLSAVNLQDSTYSLTPWHEDTPHGNKLLDSIRTFGILHPPLLQQIDDQAYRIIVGRKRIRALHHLASESPCLCRIVPAEIEEATILALLLEETLTGTPLTIVEQIFFFEKLLSEVPMEEALPMLSQLGHKPQKHVLEKLLALRSLGRAALHALHIGNIHLKSARKLLPLAETDQDILIQLITALQFGGSKQLRLIDLCTELIMRNNMSLEQILAGFPSEVIPEQPVNIPQHGAALLSWLNRGCSPRATEQENNFNQQVARLKLPPTMHIDHTPAFENEEITLSLRFPDWNSLLEVVGEIQTLMQSR